MNHFKMTPTDLHKSFIQSWTFRFLMRILFYFFLFFCFCLFYFIFLFIFFFLFCFSFFFFFFSSLLFFSENKSLNFRVFVFLQVFVVLKMHI